MALFQRKPQEGERASYITIGINMTKLIVGLGNPGKQYDLTRHNVGFISVDDFVDKTGEMSDWIDKKDMKCMFSSGQLGDTRVIAIKPTTFMNLSGDVVQAVMNFYKIQLDQILVFHDDLDVDFGQIRLRVGGSSAGHNGIKSVSAKIGESYGRARIGIGPKRPEQIQSEDYVLQKFSQAEQGELPQLIRETTSIISEFVYGSGLAHETRSFLI